MNTPITSSSLPAYTHTQNFETRTHSSTHIQVHVHAHVQTYTHSCERKLLVVMVRIYKREPHMRARTRAR